MRPRPHRTRPTANSSRFLSSLLFRYINFLTPHLARDLTVPASESGIGFQEKPLLDFFRANLAICSTRFRVSQDTTWYKKNKRKIFFRVIVVFAKFI